MALSEALIEEVARRFRLLGDPCRLRILQALREGEHTVNEVVTLVGSTQPNVSRHLQALYEVGVLGRRREGTSIHYFIADETVFALCEIVCGSARRGIEERAAAITG